MTTIEEEDELFGANLSRDFLASPNRTPGNPHRRPWQSSPARPSVASSSGPSTATDNHHNVPQREQQQDRYREPYELLDDVPPAAIPGNTPRATGAVTYSSRPAAAEATNPATKSGGANSSRYPIDNDDAISLSVNDDYSSVHSRWSANSRGGGSIAPYSPFSSVDHEGYSPSVSPSPSQYSMVSKPGRNRDHYVGLTESRSDSEVSEYRAVNNEDGDGDGDDSTREHSVSGNGQECEGFDYVMGGLSKGGGSEKDVEDDGRFNYEYDNISTAYSGLSSALGEKTSFDHLYHDGATGTGGSNNETMSVDSPDGYSPRMEYEITASSQGSVASQTSSGGSLIVRGKHYEGIFDETTPTDNMSTSERENSKWTNGKVDATAPTPQRSNQMLRPITPYQMSATTLVYPDLPQSPDAPELINNTKTPSPTTTVPGAPPRVNRTKSQGSDIFRLKGDDSAVGSKISRISGMFSEDSNNSNPVDPYVPSGKDAVTHLDSFESVIGKQVVPPQQQPPPSNQPTGPGQNSPDGGVPSKTYSPKKTPPPPSTRRLSPPKHNREESPPYSSNNDGSKHQIRMDKVPGARKEDPPDDDLGYYSQSKHAKEPEGYRQTKMFPDIDLWGDNGSAMKHQENEFEHADPATNDAVMAASNTTDIPNAPTSTTGRQRIVERYKQLYGGDSSRYYEPELSDKTHAATGRDPDGDFPLDAHRASSGLIGMRFTSEGEDDLGEYKSMHIADNGMEDEGEKTSSIDRYNDHYGSFELVTDMSYGESSTPKDAEGKDANDKDANDKDAKGKDAIGFKSNDGKIEQDYYRQTISDAIVEDMALDSSDDLTGSERIGDSFDTDIRRLAQRRQNQRQQQQERQQNRCATKKNGKKQKHSLYEVKRKDSMESDIKIDFEQTAKDEESSLQSGRQNQRQLMDDAYTDIKLNDSMEKEMSIDFDDVSDQDSDDSDGSDGDNEVGLGRNGEETIRHNHTQDRGRATRPESKIMSPPQIQRKPISFDRAEDRVNNDSIGGHIVKKCNDNLIDDKIERSSDEQLRNRSFVSDSSYSSSDASVESVENIGSDESNKSDESDETEASDDPTIFPSKAISQMNLRYNNEDYHEKESDDLVEHACHHLSRGRNDDAIQALTEALEQAQEHVADAKKRMDKFYFQKKRSDESDIDQDELEEELDSALHDSASEMANVLNNLGVVYEVKGEYERAMNSFRDALDAYRNLCHRYENAGDVDVDRTVSNILQMGMAMRSQKKRKELHDEEEDLAMQTSQWMKSDHPSVCTQLRMERLNVLICVLDLETETLGRSHPEVGYTLLKRGELHLEMLHVDMAIKDTRDAVEILTKGLGKIHPDVGLALMGLADIYNYHTGQYGYEDNKNTALSLYQEALTPLRESFGMVNPHLGLALNSIGILYSGRDDSKHAMKSFYEALAGYGVRSKAKHEEVQVAGDNGQSSRPDVFFVWINVGGLHMARKEWQLALRSYLKAQSAFRCLDGEQQLHLQKIGPRQLMRHALSSTKGRSSFQDNETLLASVLQNIGKAQSMLHRYGKAIESLEEALRIHRVVAIRANGSPNVASSRDVARILENLGEVQMISGNLTSAFSRYVESLNLLRSLSIDSKVSVEVALVLGAIGRVHLKKGEYAEAKVVLKECMRTFENLGVPPNNRKINEIRSCLVEAELALMQSATSTLAGQRREISSVPYIDKALAVDEIADEYKNKGDYTCAIWFYSEALALRRRKVDQISTSSSGGTRNSEIVDVGRTISNIAQLRTERREFGAAKILFEEARELYKSVGLSANHPFYRDLLQEIEFMRKM